MESTSTDLEAEYADRFSLYESFTLNIENVLRTLLDAANIEYLRIEARTKTKESFMDKITREDKQNKYKRLSNITDLSGIRIIGYYENDVSQICKILENNFSLDRKNSVNKCAANAPDRFGYLSIHYIISYDKVRRRLPENRQFSGLKAEIQVRTVLQHAWAVLDRRFRYNSSAEIPLPIKRKLFRIGAQLEGADEDLSDVELKIKALRASYEQKASEGKYVEQIDRDSLIAFVDNSVTVSALVPKAQERGARLVMFSSQSNKEDSASLLLKMVLGMQLSGLDDLHKLLVQLEPHADSLFAALFSDLKDTRVSKYALVRILLCISPGALAERARRYSGLGPKTLAQINQIRPTGRVRPKKATY
ncbi:MAG: hypothetical protein E5W78_00680 [Mesorhizobium sp.]|nr:MAG: hypothetical protein E5W78_00680 [Mesorhizobium sp.]TIU15786.1 MAG: hypothetical protein E5W40_02070 [Mesorhizobium sp.]